MIFSELFCKRIERKKMSEEQHNFQGHRVTVPTYCNFCTKIIFGLGKSSYQVKYTQNLLVFSSRFQKMIFGMIWLISLEEFFSKESNTRTIFHFVFDALFNYMIFLKILNFEYICDYQNFLSWFFHYFSARIVNIRCIPNAFLWFRNLVLLEIR